MADASNCDTPHRPPISYRETTPQTLLDLLKSANLHRWKGDNGRRLWENGRDFLSILGPTLPLSRLTDKSIETCVEALWNRGVPAGRINRKLADFGTMLGAALEKGWINKLPDLTPRAYCKRMPRVLSEAEGARLLECGGQDFKDVVTVALDLGLKLERVLTLTGQEIGESVSLAPERKDYLTTTPAHVVPTTERVRKLAARRMAGRNPADLLFPGLNAAEVGGPWRDAQKVMGLEHDKRFIFDCLRDTYGYHLVKRTPGGTGFMAWNELQGKCGGGLDRITQFQEMVKREQRGFTYPPKLIPEPPKKPRAERVMLPPHCPPVVPPEPNPSPVSRHKPAVPPKPLPPPAAKAPATADTGLRTVIELWDKLPEAVKRGIVAMVWATQAPRGS